MADKIKLVLALAVIAAAISGFYYFGDESLLYRVLGLLVALGVSTAIVLQTAMGQQAWSFVGDARTEVRKVVWPTRKETIQTTLIVMVMVFIVATMLWMFDMFLTWAVKMLMGQGG